MGLVSAESWKKTSKELSSKYLLFTLRKIYGESIVTICFISSLQNGPKNEEFEVLQLTLVMAIIRLEFVDADIHFLTVWVRRSGC